MAYHQIHHPHPHHHHHQNPPRHNTTTTTSYCCCQAQSQTQTQFQTPICHQPQPQPQPFSTPTTDPFLVASIVSQLLHSPNPHHIKPTNNIHQFHQDSPFLLSLLQRIDALEASLHRFSSSSGLSLRDAAARTIQSHFRSYLVSRSMTLRHLKHLASIKSALVSLNSSLSLHAFPDFDYLSHQAMDLLLTLDSIQSGDKMIKDSKRSLSREIVEFLELVDGACVKRHQLLTRKMKNMRLGMGKNDINRAVRDTKGLSGRSAGTKSRNVGNEEKKLIANLKERVEKIGRMSKALEEQEEVFGDGEINGFKHFFDEEEDDGTNVGHIPSNYRLKNGLNIKKNGQSSNAKKRVCFVEDANLIRVYDNDGDSRSALRVVDVIEDSSKERHEEEAQSDGEGSSQSSEDMRKCRSDEVSEECDNQDEEFTFSTTAPVNIEPRAVMLPRKSGVKIVG